MKPTARRCWLNLAVAAAAGSYAYPLLWMVSGSLRRPADFARPQAMLLITGRPVLQAYRAAWVQGHFSGYCRNTLVIATSRALLSVLLSSLAGYALARTRFVGQRGVLGLLVVSVFLPRGFTMLPIFELVRWLGLLNTLAAVVLVSTGGGLALNALLFTGYFLSLPTSADEAAMVDGASVPVRFCRLALPMARPMVATVALLEFTDNWNSFLVPLILTLSRPDLRPLSVGLYSLLADNGTAWPVICAGATIALAPILVLFVCCHRLMIESASGLMAGADD